MRRSSRLILLALAVVLAFAVAACATVIGLDKIQRVDCTEDCNETDATVQDAGFDTAILDTGVIDTAFMFPDIVLVDSKPPPPDTAMVPDTAVPKCTAGGCDGGYCDLDSGVCRPLYTISGTVSGLATGDSVVLQDNGGNSVTVSADGAFAFTTPLAAGTSYAVTVLTQPTTPMQACGVTGGTGIATSNVSNVTVTCVTDAYAIGGTVTGLATGDTVVLQDNGGDNLTLGSSGPFMFQTPVPSGMPYAVTVLTQPGAPVQTCTVTNGMGTATANVTNVAIACTTMTFTVGGTLTGLSPSSMVVLQDNAGDNLTLSANGAFVFATPVASGAAYAVTVLTQPTSPPQTCMISAGSGNVGSSNVTSVVVNCAVNTYVVGGTASGLATNESVTLQNNGGDSLTVKANGAFAFDTPLQPGSMYAVTVTGSPNTPVDETCTVTAGSGTIASANVTNIVLTCMPFTFTVSGTLNGLATGATVTVQNNGGDTTPLSSNGPFTFPTAVTSGQGYDVTVSQNPMSQYCAVASGGTGTVTNGNVMTVAVNCFMPAFPSTGSNGAFSPTASVVLAGGTYNYTTINVPPGVTVTASGTGILDLRASGPVVIGGTINVSGSNGGVPQQCNTYPGGGNGGATGIAGYVAAFGLGDGGAGGPGGGGMPGVSGAEAPDGSTSLGGGGGSFGGGGGGTVPTTGAGGGGGGGYAGGGGGSGGTLLGGAGGGSEGGGGGAVFWQGGAGGQFNGGGAYNGAAGENGQLGNGASNGSTGGSTEMGAGGGGGGISSAAAGDLAVATTFQTGSGGGGGSGNYSSPGGGGGGGGGALRISGSSIVVQGTGKLLAAGGAGAASLTSCNGTGPGGGGGGGSGGIVFLAAPILSVAGGATISAAAGAGATGSGGLSAGGAGGLGRLRFSLVSGASSLSGVYAPPLQGGAAMANTAGFAFIAEYPN